MDVDFILPIAGNAHEGAVVTDQKVVELTRLATKY